MLIDTAAAYDIPGTLVVSPLVATDVSSAGVGIPAMRTETTHLLTGIYHEARDRSEPFFPWFSKEKKGSS